MKSISKDRESSTHFFGILFVVVIKEIYKVFTKKLKILWKKLSKIEYIVIWFDIVGFAFNVRDLTVTLNC